MQLDLNIVNSFQNLIILANEMGQQVSNSIFNPSVVIGFFLTLYNSKGSIRTILWLELLFVISGLNIQNEVLEVPKTPLLWLNLLRVNK